MNFDFQFYTAWMASTAPLVLFCYFLTYFLVRRADGYPRCWPVIIGGAVTAIMVSPFMMAFFYDTIREFFDAPSDGTKWLMGFFVAGIGHIIAVLGYNKWQESVKDKPNGTQNKATASIPTTTPNKFASPAPQDETAVADQDMSPNECGTDAAEQEWEILAKYDLSIREAIEIVTPYGPDAIQELRRVYSIIQDKTQMPRIAREIVEERVSRRHSLEATLANDRFR